MRIIAHRGLWRNKEERNTIEALTNAVEKGFGIETDLRDYCGELVISHDMANGTSVRAEDFFRHYTDLQSNATLALNVKSDGIQKILADILKRYRITNYFMFDMSIPEMVIYKRDGFRFFTRHSDIEEQCVLYQYAIGVWLDSFYGQNWLTKDIIQKHLDEGKQICVISPEIHGYEGTYIWSMLKQYNDVGQIMLCTDRPIEAEEYFNGKN